MEVDKKQEVRDQRDGVENVSAYKNNERKSSKGMGQRME